MKGYGQGWRAGFRQSKALTERQTRERSTNFTSPNMSCEVTASLGYLPFAPRRARRLDWVGCRQTTLRTHRRKADVEGSLPESCHCLVSRFDPERSLRLPQSCRSGTQGFHEFRCSEAAVRDLTHPAITGRWRSGQDFPRWIALGDRFTAANLNPALARPGHLLPHMVVAESSFERPVRSETSPRAS